MRDDFIDCHCHLFNIDDVPIYASAKALVPCRTVVALGAFMGKLSAAALDDLEPFVRFFERPRRENLARLSREVSAVAGRLGKRKTILTPLIMDFSLVPGSEERLADQVHYLREAILVARADGELPGRTRVFPFLGLDLRRFDRGDPLEKMSRLEERFGPIRAGTPPSRLRDGDFIGIKLYPPLGAGPMPDPGDTAWRVRRRRYLELFRFWTREGIPVTTHCQAGSHRAYKITKKEIRRLAGPKRWKAVLEDPECSDLRINFAHFGGEEEVVETVARFLREEPYRGGGHRRTWTWGILDLLKRYPNTYADLSAYAWDSVPARRALRTMLALDEAGAFDPELGREPAGGFHRLRDKLMWGSDVPMVLGSLPSYSAMFSLFERAVNVELGRGDLERRLARIGASPPGVHRRECIDHLVSGNPRRFLFGQA